MILTRKQRAVVRLTKVGLGPSAIARETGLARETVSRLLSRAKRNLRDAGFSPEKLLDSEDYDLLELST
jgi:DNA-directed RNA polymerase specialized sigma24 family protein